MTTGISCFLGVPWPVYFPYYVSALIFQRLVFRCGVDSPSFFGEYPGLDLPCVDRRRLEPPIPSDDPPSQESCLFSAGIQHGAWLSGSVHSCSPGPLPLGPFRSISCLLLPFCDFRSFPADFTAAEAPEGPSRHALTIEQTKCHELTLLGIRSHS